MKQRSIFGLYKKISLTNPVDIVAAVVFSSRAVARKKIYDFLRPTSFLKEPGRPWYTCVEPTAQ